MIGIKDIAKECGVSVSTVSRALNNSLEISPKTREYILQVCTEQGYQPNAVARSLILNKTGMIGLVVPDITNQYYAFISKGISAYLEKCGYGLLLCNSDRNKSNEIRYFNFLAGKRVDGAIVIPIGDDKNEYNCFQKTSTPFVLIDNYIADIDASFVTNDNYAGARKIVQHMVECGYRRIGIILGDGGSSASNERFSGYRDVLTEAKIGFDSELVIHSQARFSDGVKYASVLLEKQVDAIFAINDTVAMGVLKYCHENGIRVPADLGLAGYDDIEQAGMLHVPLTTVHQRKFVLGEKAAEVLMEEIKDQQKPKQKIILQPKLVVRNSCGE